MKDLDQNKPGKIESNYSMNHAVNRVYSYLCVGGSGVSLEHVDYVKDLVRGRLETGTVCSYFDEEQRYAKKDSVNQGRALVRALSNISNILEAAEKAAKEPRDDHGMEKKE